MLLLRPHTEITGMKIFLCRTGDCLCLDDYRVHVIVNDEHLHAPDALSPDTVTLSIHQDYPTVPPLRLSGGKECERDCFNVYTDVSDTSGAL